MAKIKKIVAREILDSRGKPTIEAIVELTDSSVGIFSCPSGSSVGKHEAVELRDQDLTRYQGLGVLKNLEKIVTVIAPQLIGQDAQNQENIDAIMIALDGRQDKSNLGANSILALSGAVAKAQATSEKKTVYQYIAKLLGNQTREFSIPTPMFNVINGGKHGTYNLDFQEFMIVPVQASSYSRSLKIGVECYANLREILKGHNASTLVGDEGGYGPNLYSNMDALKLLEEAIVKSGYKLGQDAFLSLDIAANNILSGGAYRIKDKPVALTATDFIDFYIGLNEQFHLLSLEDPLEEDDWDSWQILTGKLGGQTLIVGDDLIVTNEARLKKAISTKACNAIVIKPNQAGTISETLKVVKLARENKFKIVASSRSGETNDDFIADFAIGIGADYVKFGAPARGERVAKYNRLLEVEHELS